MTLRDLLEILLEEEEENILDKEIVYYIKDNPDGTFDAMTIKSIAITNQYILLTKKFPDCEEENP